MKKILIVSLVILGLSCNQETITPISIKEGSVNDLFKPTNELIVNHIKENTFKDFSEKLNKALLMPEGKERSIALSSALGFKSYDHFIDAARSFDAEIKMILKTDPNFFDHSNEEVLKERLHFNSSKSNSNARAASDLDDCLDSAAYAYFGNLAICYANAQLCPAWLFCFEICIGSAALAYGTRMAACYIVYPVVAPE